MSIEQKYAEAVICDLDGTLALLNGRNPFDWNKIGVDKADLLEAVAVYRNEFNLTVFQVRAVNQPES